MSYSYDRVAAKTYRLPSGKTTKSVEEYQKAWEGAAKALVKKTGWTLAGYDPNLLFDTPSGRLALTLGQVKDLTK